MSEETIQSNVENVEVEGNLFAEDIETEDETTESELEPDAKEEVVDEKAKEDVAKSAENKLKIKYNGEEKEISQEEAVTLAQKGMNYDHLKAELESLKNSDELTWIAKMAKQAGAKDVKSFIEETDNSIKQNKVDLRASELEDEGMSKEHAIRTAKAEIELESLKDVKPLQTEKEADDTSIVLTKSYTKMFQAFPETKDYKNISDFPPEVIKRLQNNPDELTPFEIYQDYKMDLMKKELEIVKQNESAKKRSLGSVRSPKSDEADDPFLMGFNGK